MDLASALVMVNPTFSPASPLTISEGESQLIEPQGAYYRVRMAS